MGFRERVEAWEHGSAVLSPVSATNTANAARRVSRAWHELAQARGLPWWCVAALESAAEGFADLARDWEEHDGNVGRVGAAVDGGRGDRGDGGGNRDGRVVSAGSGAGRWAVRGDAGAAGGPDRLDGMRGVPSPAPRPRGRTGGAAGSPRREA
jgi:hypothetical protein